ncbi:E3 ubiquitin- ligase TRIM39-like protein [Labeo rohita]|uniref:E3 ubiquitin-ligase TRIM39-like protein n=1 Tax=Labeo rohita TaxID=84645 RepID=A0A498MUL4_LABRO|nr:E3 ubiquitin- ligase TRIM39-like protein [Labeo rohita]
MIQNRMEKIQEIQHSVEERKNKLVKTKIDVQQMIQDRMKKIQEIQHSVELRKRGKPKAVGVFVDYEEGLVSFYDVGSRSHIYSFIGQTFTDKLYPYFSPGHNEEESAGSDTDKRAGDDPEQNEEDSRDPALSRGEKGTDMADKSHEKGVGDFNLHFQNFC